MWQHRRPGPSVNESRVRIGRDRPGQSASVDGFTQRRQHTYTHTHTHTRTHLQSSRRRTVRARRVCARMCVCVYVTRLRVCGCVLDATRLRRRWWGTPSPVNACSGGGGGGDDDDARVRIRRPPLPPPPPYVYVSDVTTGGLLAPLLRRPRSPRYTAKRRRRRLPPPTPPTRPPSTFTRTHPPPRLFGIILYRTVVVLSCIRRAPASFTCVYTVCVRLSFAARFRCPLEIFLACNFWNKNRT